MKISAPTTLLKEAEAVPTSAKPNKKTAHKCSHCGNSRGAKRWRFICSGNRSGYLCGPSIHELGGPAEALRWLEANLPFNLEARK